MKKQENNNGMSTEAKIGIGASIAAAGVAAYLLFGPEGKKNRKVIRGWAVKMKGEIIEKFEEAKELTEPLYNSIIDEVSAKYSKMKNIDESELLATVADIRKHWKTMSKGTKSKVKSKLKQKAKPLAKASQKVKTKVAPKKK